MTESGGTKQGFNTRAFLALASALSGILLPVTGLAAHAAERSAHPTWAAVHTLLGALFVVCATWHAVLNRRAIANYLTGRSRGSRIIAPEPVCAVVLVLAVVLLAAGHRGHGEDGARHRMGRGWQTVTGATPDAP